MQKRDFKRPNFSIDRAKRGNLAKQIAFGLRTAIETGYYRPGEILPPVRDLAEILGVSMGIAVQAVNGIREAGLISPRPAVGSVVCAKNRPLWKGQVLIVVPAGIGNPDDNAVYAVLRDKLTVGGYLPLVATVPYVVSESGRRYDFALLDSMMRQQIDLVVQLHDQPEIARWLSRRGVPFVRYTRTAFYLKNCVGAVVRAVDLALADFVSHCREVGVKDVLEVRVWRGGLSVAAALKKAGIGVETLNVPLADGRCTAYSLSKWAADDFMKRKHLPELVFFQDDHLTTGALLAFGERGIKVPRDVKVVTWANRDYGPVAIRPLTRMEMDVASFGEKVSSYILEYFRTGIFPECAAVGPKYVRGESF